MSLFWKKMKALFLQTKICEVSQIRINKNPLCLVVNNHLLKVNIQPNMVTQTIWRSISNFNFLNFRCGIQ